MNTTQHISQLIMKLSYCIDTENSANCTSCEKRLAEYIHHFTDTNKPLQFILPGFPAKSANRNKTLSALPDLGETLGLKRLSDLIHQIQQCYTPGAQLVICSDGLVFNDLVKVSTHDVEQYQQALRKLCDHLSFKHISFYRLSNAFPQSNTDSKRQLLISQYARDIATIRENILSDNDERLTFNGIHRFIYEDLRHLTSQQSNNQIKKLAKVISYQVIQRSHAWSALIAEKFPHAIRLSIHPHLCKSNKISIKLIEGADNWATPWHNVTVKTQQGFKLIKKQQADNLGATLHHPGTQEAHYVL
ncbi:MAG: isocyanide synthase family protein [Coxiellaceae bacterium]|nr:isocyanide synthase family protein [Coxiellaceae bacterium]